MRLLRFTRGGSSASVKWPCRPGVTRIERRGSRTIIKALLPGGSALRTIAGPAGPAPADSAEKPIEVALNGAGKPGR